MINPSHPAKEPLSGKSGQAPVAPTHGGGVKTGGVATPKDIHYDPAGKPISFGSGSMCGQQAGGDLTGRDPERRDDNFIDDASVSENAQLGRDIGTRVDDFGTEAAPQPAQTPIEPDGTEDPLAGLDDEMSVSNNKDKAGQKN
jgi:hypothetical protein